MRQIQMAPNKILLSVIANLRQAMIAQVKFQKWLSKTKVTGTREDSDSGAETKSEARCVKRAPVNPEKNITGQRNYKRSRPSWHLIIYLLLDQKISPLR